MFVKSSDDSNVYFRCHVTYLDFTDYSVKKQTQFEWREYLEVSAHFIFILIKPHFNLPVIYPKYVAFI